MLYLAAAISVFLFFVLSHILCFRLHLFRFHTAGIVLLGGIWAAVYLFFVFYYLPMHTPGTMLSDPFWGVPFVWSSLLVYAVLWLWYLGLVGTAQHESPSLRILNRIERQKGHTIKARELEGIFSNKELILDRLEDLVEHGHARREKNRYFIQPRGALVARCIFTYRKLLGRGMGG